jgi:hypothetical protein
MADEENNPEDLTMTEEEIKEFQRRKDESARKNPSNTVPVLCPDCNCEYIIPLMTAFFTKSFASNRMTIVWPSRNGTNDTALVACPACFIIYHVREDGAMIKTDKTLKGKK